MVNSKAIGGIAAGIVIVVIAMVLTSMDSTKTIDEIVISDSSQVETENQDQDTASYVIDEEGNKSFIISTRDVPDIDP